jgi:hypothetical protein
MGALAVLSEMEMPPECPVPGADPISARGAEQPEEDASPAATMRTLATTGQGGQQTLAASPGAVISMVSHDARV